jgi:hypothetical protein
MGQIWRPNQALSTNLLLEVLQQVKDRIKSSQTGRDEKILIVLHTLIVTAYVLSLRGPEGFLLDLSGLRRFQEKTHSEKGKEYLIVTLRGKIKGEHNQREHQLPSAPINVKESIDDFLLNLKKSQGRISGPAISDEAGVIFGTRAMHDALHEVLEDLFVTKRGLFPTTIEDVDELQTRYQVFRSFLRSSDTRALDQRVAETDIVNCWASVEKGEGKTPRPGNAKLLC